MFNLNRVVWGEAYPIADVLLSVQFWSSANSIPLEWLETVETMVLNGAMRRNNVIVCR